MTEKKPLIILTGPTAVGKTALSIALAKSVDAEIISADSMQVYRGMDIGSAKITEEEKQGIPHYLIDVLEPTEEFNVVIFQKMAKEAMNNIYQRNKIPLIVGGTGFYIQALLYDIDFTENGADHTYRRQLEQIAACENGASILHNMLEKVDPLSAEVIHANNSKRVIRALEYYRETGQPISGHNKEQRMKQSPFNFCYFCLTDDRALIYDRIEKRVDQMFTDGLVDEVRLLRDKGCDRSLISMQGLGYKEILSFLDGEISLEEANYLIKRDTRHFAKRQLTWFNRERDITWIDRQLLGNDTQTLLQFMLSSLEEKDIISHVRS